LTKTNANYFRDGTFSKRTMNLMPVFACLTRTWKLVSPVPRRKKSQKDPATRAERMNRQGGGQGPDLALQSAKRTETQTEGTKKNIIKATEFTPINFEFIKWKYFV
jgi:hypothetical protein